MRAAVCALWRRLLFYCCRPVQDKEMGELSAQRQREQQEAVAAKEREVARITEEKAALQAEVDKMGNTSETQVRASLLHRHLLGGGGGGPWCVVRSGAGSRW
jgi:hypothetical protein